MGMFDNIICEKSLPFSEEINNRYFINSNNIIFQTKELGCLLDNYIIEMMIF